jgi:hypothetical protein
MQVWVNITTRWCDTDEMWPRKRSASSLTVHLIL